MKSNFPESKQNSTPQAEFSDKLSFRDYLKATDNQANKPLPIGRLIAPLLVQIGMILAVPSQAAYTDVTGKAVILQTLPVSSSDVLRNSSLSLDYSIARTQTLRRLRGWSDWVRRHSLRNGQITPGSTLYLILQERQSFGRRIPRPWKPIRVANNHPNSLPNNQIALKGNYEEGMINYGLENYYIPEEQRRQINNDILQAQQNRNGKRPQILVKVKVDPQGNALPVSLWIGDRNYRY